MKKKKGQGHTFHVIVTAVVALVVLVILLLIFTGKTDKVSKGLFDCEDKGGTCVEKNEEGAFVCPEGTKKSSVLTCPKEKGKEFVCCLGIEEDTDDTGGEDEN